MFSLAPPLIIIEQPEELITARGDQACFSVSVDGGVGDINYQWRRDGYDLIDGGNISGSSTDTLCIDPASSSDEGLYDVANTDVYCQIISEPAELIVIDPILYADGTCPQGGAITINWTDAYPAGQIAILFAANTGNFTIPGSLQCAGTRLGLGYKAIQLGYKGYAGDDGSREIHASARPNACGGYLQLIDLTICVVSNVVRIE